MKRKHIEKYKFLYQCRPWFFWQKCDKCDKDFRREKGFRALTGPYHGGVGVWRYLCKSCSPSFEIANDYFLHSKYRPKRPSYPPKYPTASHEVS